MRRPATDRLPIHYGLAAAVKIAASWGDSALSASSSTSAGVSTSISPDWRWSDYLMTGGGPVVTDTKPTPTAKDQCKNGGWRSFPGFKNQGDCVSLVATKGKKQPGGREPRPR